MKYSITAIAIALLATVNAQSVPSSLPKLSATNRICDYQSNGYFFSSLRTYGPDSRAFCESIGAELVSVNNSNFADLTQMIVKCLGPGQKAWINSWDGNTFANSPLAIWTGLQSGSGSININIEKEPLFAICSVRRRGLSRPEPRPIIAAAASILSQGPTSSIASHVAASSTTYPVPSISVDVKLPSASENAVFAEGMDFNDAIGFDEALKDVLQEVAAENALEDTPAEVENGVPDRDYTPDDVGNEVSEEEEAQEEEAQEEVAQDEVVDIAQELEDIVPEEEEIIPEEEEIIPEEEEIVPEEQEIVPEEQEIIPEEQEIVQEQEEIMDEEISENEIAESEISENNIQSIAPQMFKYTVNTNQ